MFRIIRVFAVFPDCEMCSGYSWWCEIQQTRLGYTQENESLLQILDTMSVDRTFPLHVSGGADKPAIEIICGLELVSQSEHLG